MPALAETVPGFETVAWFGVLAPTGTPKAATPEAFAARVNGDVARRKKLATEK